MLRRVESRDDDDPWVIYVALLSAATIVAIAPVIVLLPFMRRYLIKGISLGALK